MNMEHRIIKFRIWDGEKMWYPETKTQDRNATSLTFFNRKKSIGWGLYDPQYEYKVCSGEYHNLMQYIGLNDVKGKEVYEGDIVQDQEFDNYEVIFRKGCYCYKTGENQYHIFNEKHIKIIGNIYENKELLGKN